MSGFLSAVGFLTRVPLRRHTDLSRAVPWLPWVGGLIGFAIAGVYAGGRELLTPLLGAAIATAFGMMLTGAFHEDGLADVADAFEPTRSRDEIMRILKDPRHGTYGVVALIVTIAVRVAAIAALGISSAFAALPAAHALGRAAAIGLIGPGNVAPESSLASSLASATSRSMGRRARMAGSAIALLLLGLWALPAMALAAIGALSVHALAVRRIGGINGDVLGAAEQVVEMLVLVLAVGASRVTSPVLAWWWP
jgi:adenosylcobinamide-GDP ribazoletransferase